MPNTLIHIGVQGSVFANFLFRGTDIRWVLLGCLLPDFPWILNRILLEILPQDEYSALICYILILSSFGASLLLAFAFALLSREVTRTFVVLALGALTHLLLDACQDKWGNGVLLLAPFDWNLIHFDLYSVESPLTLILSCFGALYAFFACKRSFSRKSPVPLLSPFWRRAALAFLALYLWLPSFFLEGPWKADTGYHRTFYLKGDRTGRFIEFDRAPFIVSPEGKYLYFPLFGEKIFLDGVSLTEGGALSVKGVFLAPDRIMVKRYRVEPKTFRDTASYAGIIYICLAWLSPLRGRSARKEADCTSK